MADLMSGSPSSNLSGGNYREIVDVPECPPAGLGGGSRAFAPEKRPRFPLPATSSDHHAGLGKAKLYRIFNP